VECWLTLQSRLHPPVWLLWLFTFQMDYPHLKYQILMHLYVWKCSINDIHSILVANYQPNECATHKTTQF
jgi:hypothetical protein